MSLLEMIIDFLYQNYYYYYYYYGHYDCCVGPAHGCGGVMNLTENSTLSLSSPDTNNDGMYNADLDCVWTVITTSNNIINLQFNSFILDDQSDTCPDYVEVCTLELLSFIDR